MNSVQSLAKWHLLQEARALLTRLDRLRPYALNMPMVPAATISPVAQVAIEKHMIKARKKLKTLSHHYIHWLQGPDGKSKPASEAQRRFTILKLNFNNVITQFDIFADVLTQRSEHQTGVWVAGLDDVASEALELPGYYKAPPVICYVVRGHGAAIRRAMTRLPGGESNPVAIIKVPRERMVGSGIASSLVHEVGHQGAALLDLINSLKPELRRMRQQAPPQERPAWDLWDLWISEILADLWSVAKVGISATTGMMGVLSLPRPFVFRPNFDDPHQMAYIRVILSAEMGNALYPHPQWQRIIDLWVSLYPLEGLDEKLLDLITQLRFTMRRFITLMIHHRPKALRGKRIGEALAIQERNPERLKSLYPAWKQSPEKMKTVPPGLVFATLGQARADGKITPEEESKLLAEMLTFWAVNSALTTSAVCARTPKPRTHRTTQQFQNTH